MSRPPSSFLIYRTFLVSWGLSFPFIVSGIVQYIAVIATSRTTILLSHHHRVLSICLQTVRFKYSSTIGISCKFHPSMPRCPVLRLSLLLLILLHCIFSTAFAAFPVGAMVDIFFLRKLNFYFLPQIVFLNDFQTFHKMHIPSSKITFSEFFQKKWYTVETFR